MEPNADERERAMGFPTRVTAVPSLSEESRCQVSGQVMDLNCLTWILSLGVAEQRRLRIAEVVTHPLVSLMSTRRGETPAGGDERMRSHPWSTWEAASATSGEVFGPHQSSGGDVVEQVAPTKPVL